MKRIIFITLTFLLVTGQLANAQTRIFVSPSGNDKNSGTKVQPLLSLYKAKEVALKALQSGKTTIIYLREGEYFLDKTICFDENYSGLEIKAYDKKKPVVYGGVRVTNWEKWKGEIYRAKSPVNDVFYRLFENGRSAIMARNPNVGSGFGGGLKKINNTTVSVPLDWKNYDFSNAQIYTWIGANWFAEVRDVLDFDRESNRLTIDAGSNLYGGANNRMFIYGVPELLDEKGEWCLNPSDGYIYYWPRSKKDINKQTVVVPTEENVVEIMGSNMDAVVRNITIDGISFFGSDFTNSWRTFTRKEGEGSLPNSLQKGLIYIENADKISIRNCKISGAGHSAVFINNRSSNCEVYGCWIEDAGFCGVYMNSYVPGKGPFETVEESYVNKGHKISNNFIYDCGKFVGGGCGIQFYQSGDNEITHNVIAKMPRYGISYKGMRNEVLVSRYPEKNINYTNHFDYIHTRNNIIAYNDIFNVCRSSFDFGAIESWGGGRDNIWIYNAIHDIDQSVHWDGWAHGLFPDDGSDYLLVKGNIIYELNGGVKTGAIMMKSIENVVEHNIIADCNIGRGISLTPYCEPSAKNTLRRNIFYNLGNMLYDIRESSPLHSYVGNYENEYNAKMVEGIPVFEQVDLNLVFPHDSQLDSARKYGWDKNSVTVDPLFDKKNPQWDVTYKDYNLKQSSPAFKLGFNSIKIDKIGLKNDFLFERNSMMVKDISEAIEAEDYNRMRGLRTKGDVAIYHMEKDSWSKYEKVDFKKGKMTNCRIVMSAPKKGLIKNQKVFELRIGSPNGRIIGTVFPDDEVIKIEKIKGQENLFLVFQQDCILDKIIFEL